MIWLIASCPVSVILFLMLIWALPIHNDYLGVARIAFGAAVFWNVFAFVMVLLMLVGIIE